MKKIENRLAYFLLTLAIYLLNIKNLSLLAILLGSIFSSLLIFLFDYLNVYKYKITKVLLFFTTIFFCTFYLNKISIFISDNILRDYSLISINLTLLLTIFYLVKKGYHPIIKVIMLASYFIFFIFLIGFLIASPYLNLGNLTLDIFKSNNLFIESIYYTMLIVYVYFLIYPVTNTRFQIKDLIINSSYQVITFLNIVSILGVTLTSLYKYPYIVIFKMVSLIDFIERIEIIFSMNYLFCFYFLLLISFYQLKYLSSKVIKKDKKLNLFLIFLFILIFLGCNLIN